MLRYALLSFVVLGSLAAPAMADGVKTGGLTLPFPSFSGGNSANVNNNVSGTNATGNQQVDINQQSGRGYRR
jgi:hypothetical protein